MAYPNLLKIKVNGLNIKHSNDSLKTRKLMKQLLLALGATLIVSAPVIASPHFKSNPTFHKHFYSNNPITGKVTDDKGDPLAGVTVQVKGLKTSVIT